jgi:hypothetical protein
LGTFNTSSAFISLPFSPYKTAKRPRFSAVLRVPCYLAFLLKNAGLWLLTYEEILSLEFWGLLAPQGLPMKEIFKGTS